MKATQSTRHRIARRLAPSAMRGVERPVSSRKEIKALTERVVELERDAQEARQLNRRVAELADVMEELLLPLGLRDEKRLAELLEKYETGL